MLCLTDNLLIAPLLFLFRNKKLLAILVERSKRFSVKVLTNPSLDSFHTLPPPPLVITRSLEGLVGENLRMLVFKISFNLPETFTTSVLSLGGLKTNF